MLTIGAVGGRDLMNAAAPAAPVLRKLLAQATCPHCWHRFAPEEVLWIAAHLELSQDPLLGDQPLRFPPSRFTPAGSALDAKGMACRELGCPRCHLPVLRDLLEIEPLFLSIVGEGASGKSFFLTAMIEQLRDVLFHQFHVEFADADPSSNSLLTGYIESLFGRPDEDAPIPLERLMPKTNLRGDLYRPVTFGEQTIWYPQPFLFALRPTADHPTARAAATLARILCLYDNAGEHFQPGGHKVANPCADHLALSSAILFLFDPSRDRKFREECRGETQPKVGQKAPSQQVTILNEVASRVRSYRGMQKDQHYEKPLIIVLTKFDAWSHLLEDDGADPWKSARPGTIAGLDLGRIHERSRRLRDLMMRYCRDVVAAAEGFARDVTYIAVSALGERFQAGRLIVDDQSQLVSIRPKDIRPYWVAVPFLYAVSRALPGLIPHLKPPDRGAGANGPPGREVRPATAAETSA
jgi:hypothetical protein